MGKSDLTNFSTFECRSVLDSIQHEYDQLQKQDNTLSKLQEELNELIAQRNVWAKSEHFNEKNCVICCLTFNLLFKRKLLCQICQLYVCRSCAVWDHFSKQWLCHICEKQKLLDAASNEWISSRIKTNFGNFSAAKVLQNFFRQRRISDSENDSGYGTTGDFLPLMKFLSSHSLNKDLKMTDLSSHEGDCEDEEEEVNDEEELQEIQDSIETILEGLLGGVLDDASVDQLYPNSELYLSLFSDYHSKLVKVIENLSRALQKALHNLPFENGITPTTAHAALKNVIASLIDECQDMPFLESTNPEDLPSHQSLSFNFANVLSSYESLVAAAIINKVIEESQSKYKSCTYLSPQLSSQQEIINHSNDINSTAADDDESLNHILNSSFDLPMKCVQIEEIEEITQEFTDSEDDKLSSISKYSNSLQNIDEVGMPKHSYFDSFINLDHTRETPTPFPEFGVDLVDNFRNEDSLSPCHPVSITSWEENWLFKKRKRVPLYSNLKYQLMTYCDEPPSMLIPLPSESTDVDQYELSSELSETHSAGSLDFSSDPESLEAEESKLNIEDSKLSKSIIQTSKSSLPILSTEQANSRLPDMCHTVGQSNKKELSSSNLTEEAQDEKYVVSNSKEELNNNEKSDKLNSKCVENKKERVSPADIEGFVDETPPRPGTIAEREHKKWLNAVPLKHNPYSAENISKRYIFNKKTGFHEQVSSFEEFERKLSISSDTYEMPLNKVNCGPKSIDSELYKRDYYINKGMESSGNTYTLRKSPRQRVSSDDCFLPADKISYSYEEKKSPWHCTAPDDCFLPIDEALNSFEEKVYVRSGKVFTLENHIRRLEREINDNSSKLHRKLYAVDQGKKVIHKDLDSSNKKLCMANKPEVEKLKKSKPCQKVHSLTARSLSREFRDLAKLNLPKPVNRTIPVRSNASEESERENVCSPELVQSSLNATHGDNGHGYTSDESNTSSNSTSKLKTGRHISRSILERATYWERRAEQGLLSDASVGEEFPGIDVE